MNLNSIEYVLTIAEEGSFSKAAKKLIISQPALSQYIKNLENELQAPIFYRNTHSIELTPVGKVLMDDGKLLLKQRDILLNKIASMVDSMGNTVRFGIPPCYSKYYVPKILFCVEKVCPGVKVEVLERISELLEDAVINNEIDFCLVPAEPKKPELCYETLYDEEIMLAVPSNHQYNLTHIYEDSNNAVNLSYFKDDPFILRIAAPKLSNSIIKNLFEEACFYPKKIFETINWDTVNSLVAEGLGVGFIPKPLIEEFNSKDNSPKYYHLKSSYSTFRQYSVAYMKDTAISTTVKLVITCVKDALI